MSDRPFKAGHRLSVVEQALRNAGPIGVRVADYFEHTADPTNNAKVAISTLRRNGLHIRCVRHSGRYQIVSADSS